MKRGHVPIRTCIGCRRRRPAGEMIRLGAVGNMAMISCRRDNLSGRGCYVCPHERCIEAALKRGRLEKALRRPITEAPSKEGLLGRLERKGVTGWLC